MSTIDRVLLLARAHTSDKKQHLINHNRLSQTYAAGICKVARLQLVWYWPGMIAEVRRILRSCEVCKVAKPGGNRPPGSRPWQKVAIDLVGPLPRTRRGNQWILVLSDHFTRWQDAIAIPDATAPTVATTLDERVFCYFGLPEQIHSDLGRQFKYQLMAGLCAF